MHILGRAVLVANERCSSRSLRTSSTSRSSGPKTSSPIGDAAEPSGSARLRLDVSAVAFAAVVGHELAVLTLNEEPAGRRGDRRVPVERLGATEAAEVLVLHRPQPLQERVEGDRVGGEA